MSESKNEHFHQVASDRVQIPVPAGRLTEEELATVQAGKSREIVVVGSKVKEVIRN